MYSIIKIYIETVHNTVHINKIQQILTNNLETIQQEINLQK